MGEVTEPSLIDLYEELDRRIDFLMARYPAIDTTRELADGQGRMIGAQADLERRIDLVSGVQAGMMIRDESLERRVAFLESATAALAGQLAELAEHMGRLVDVVAAGRAYMRGDD